MTWKVKVTAFCKQNTLLVSTVVSVFLGIAFGLGLRPFDLSPTVLKLISFPGEMFMAVLKMMILPLIFSSLISALAQMDSSCSGKMGISTVIYYTCTAMLGIILGIVLVSLIHPGHPDVKELSNHVKQKSHISALDTLLDMVRNMLPENIVKATFEQQQTVYEQNSNGSIANEQGEVVSRDGTNILGIIVFCSGFGIVLSKMGAKAKPVVDFFVVLDEAILQWVRGLMCIAPVGICCLIYSNLLLMEDPSRVATALLTYVITVLLGVILHTFLILPIIYFLITRKNPLHIMNGMIQPVLTTLGTSSGGAVLPISIQCMEEHCNIDRRVAGFVLPLGCTINMDGNALYEAVAVIFVAQLNNIHLTFAEIVTVSVTATVASLGLNNVPAGLVSILIILNTIGLPTEDVALLLTVDWLLYENFMTGHLVFRDRVRSALNVLGDGFATSVVSHLIKDSLVPEEPKSTKPQDLCSQTSTV